MRCISTFSTRGGPQTCTAVQLYSTSITKRAKRGTSANEKRTREIINTRTRTHGSRVAHVHVARIRTMMHTVPCTKTYLLHTHTTSTYRTTKRNAGRRASRLAARQAGRPAGTHKPTNHPCGSSSVQQQQQHFAIRTRCMYARSRAVALRAPSTHGFREMQMGYACPNARARVVCLCVTEWNG